MISQESQFQTLKRILVCGLGSIGRRHVRILRQLLPGIEISVLRSGHGPECPELTFISHQFFDLESAITWKPDAAIVSSPAPFHQGQALALTRKDIPVLIEKPVGIGVDSQQGWDELLLKSQTVPVSIGYVLRYDPCASYIRKALRKQEFGKVLEADFYCGSWLPDWRSTINYTECVSSRRSLGGGALYELSHEIDLAFWFLDDFQLTFASLRKSGLLDIDVEDQVLLVGNGTQCPQITIRLNFCSRPPRRNVLIRCEKGELNWNLLEGEVKISSLSGQKYFCSHPSDSDDRYRLQAEHFFECITNGATPYCSLNDGLQVLKLIIQAQDMMNNEGINSRVRL